jgi:hypothetical protein
MPTHGKGANIFANGFDLSPFLSSIDQTQTVDTAEVTTFTAQSKAYVAGQVDGTLSMSGYFDGVASGVDEVLSAALDSDSATVLTVAEGGVGMVGNRALVASGLASGYNITASVSEAVQVSAEFQLDGSGIGNFGTHRGVVLANGTSITSASQNYSAIDNGGASSNGIIANLHITASDQSTIAKIQHSTDNVNWSDLVTFASIAAGRGAERKIVTGTVNRYLRATWSGTLGTRTVVITAARM